MTSKIWRNIVGLDTEEKILNGAVICALVSLFFPWVSGEWLGGSILHSGFGFFTSFIGIIIFLLHFFALLITVLPIVGGPIVIKKRYREIVRLSAMGLATILVLAILSVLMKVTFEFSRMEVRFGIYLCLISSLVALFFAASRFYEKRRDQSQELFHHPEDKHSPIEGDDITPPPPPPPPPPAPAPEEHPLYP